MCVSFPKNLHVLQRTFFLYHVIGTNGKIIILPNLPAPRRDSQGDVGRALALHQAQRGPPSSPEWVACLSRSHGGRSRHSFSAGLVWLELQGSSRLHVRPTLQSTSCVPGMVQA